MLRIHLEESAEARILRLEGKLVDPWVDELAKAWAALAGRLPPERSIRIDLEAVSFVDAHGRSLLQMLRRTGCRLLGSGPFIAAVIEESALASGPAPGAEAGLAPRDR